MRDPAAIAGLKHLNCTYFTTSEIVGKCRASVGDPAPAAKKIDGLALTSCRWKAWFLGKKRELGITRKYDLYPSESGFKIQHRVFFKIAKEDRARFEAMVGATLDRVKAFFQRQGIAYDFRFTTDPTERRRLKPHAVVRVDFLEKRSNSYHWHLGGIELRNFLGPLDFGHLMAHELSHRLGLDDHYVDDSQKSCQEEYGVNGYNSKRPEWLLCGNVTDPDAGRLCQDIMDGGLPESAVYTTRDAYSLVQPYCPELCNFDGIETKFEYSDYTISREYLRDAVKKLQDTVTESRALAKQSNLENRELRLRLQAEFQPLFEKDDDRESYRNAVTSLYTAASKNKTLPPYSDPVTGMVWLTSNDWKEFPLDQFDSVAAKVNAFAAKVEALPDAPIPRKVPIRLEFDQLESQVSSGPGYLRSAAKSLNVLKLLGK